VINYGDLTRQRKKGVWLRTLNCGEIMRKHIGKLMEDQGYFSKVGLYRSLLAPFPMPGMFSPSWYREGTFFTKNFMPYF